MQGAAAGQTKASVLPEGSSVQSPRRNLLRLSRVRQAELPEVTPSRKTRLLVHPANIQKYE